MQQCKIKEIIIELKFFGGYPGKIENTKNSSFQTLLLHIHLEDISTLKWRSLPYVIKSSSVKIENVVS